MAESPNPSTPSSDYEAMLPYWTLARAIMAGLPAMVDAGDAYLPRHEKEGVDAYKLRLRHARLTNIFAKTIADLSLRPFTHPVMIVSEDTTPALRETGSGHKHAPQLALTTSLRRCFAPRYSTA